MVRLDSPDHRQILREERKSGYPQTLVSRTPLTLFGTFEAYQSTLRISASALPVSCLIIIPDVLQLTWFIGYPDGHPDTSLDEDIEIENLKAKVDAGADFIITQLFYDVDQFIRWVKKVRAKGKCFIRQLGVCVINLRCFVGITIPIIPGIMPIQTYATFARLTKLCGTKVPQELEEALTPLKVTYACVYRPMSLTRPLLSAR
jgi:hypothetical protein